jgi:hypothetical protein
MVTVSPGPITVSSSLTVAVTEPPAVLEMLRAYARGVPGGGEGSEAGSQPIIPAIKAIVIKKILTLFM